MAIVLHRIVSETIINPEMKGNTLPSLFQDTADAISRELAAHGLSISGLGYSPKTGDWHCCASAAYNKNQLKLVHDVVEHHVSQIDPSETIRRAQENRGE